MPIYKAPARDLTFVANELLGFEQYREAVGCPDADPETLAAIFEEAGKLAEQVVHPLNQPGDEQGCRYEDGVVTVPDGFPEAYKMYAEAGWCGLSVEAEYGGQGMPALCRFLVNELFTAANHSWFMYPTLTDGAYDAVLIWGDEATKQRYLPKFASGDWSGTMNLTEAHAGTDVGMIRTQAQPQADGSYKISGSKIFISAGEHEMTENIVHLVLARLPDAPGGTKGISLFIVPKFLINDDGSIGERNGVRCDSIEHKMGIRASATCVMNYDNATGYLIGEPNKGLRAMFTMMNSARLGVAVEGVGAAEISYQNAVAYAKDRLQGRALTGPVVEGKPADPLIVHPDIRRMLLRMRSFTEGARALAGFIALQIDLSHKHPDEAEREKAEDLLGLLTPVAKSFFTDEGFSSANLAVQVYGGHGYIVEHGVEQFVRDARISQIYEGANGIQALDLVGRKLAMNGGRAVRTFFAAVGASLQQEAAAPELQDYVVPLQAAFDSLQGATGWLMQNAMNNPNHAGAASADYLRLFAIVSVGWMWLRSARVCVDTLTAGTEESAFYETKLAVGRFFMERYLAEHSALLQKVQAGSDVMMSLAEDAF